MCARWTAAVVVMMAAVAGGPVAAQDAYVGASLTADVVRFSGSETPVAADLSPDGEALGFALRIGTRLGSAWGVEAEVARAAEIERESAPGAVAFPRLTDPAAVAGNRGVAFPGVEPLIFPPLRYRVRTAYQDVSFSAGIWARQDFTARFALVYAGGVAFHKSERESEIAIDAGSLLPEIPGLVVSPRTVTEVTIYTTRPFAGIEGRVRMTEHVELVPGVRVHGLQGGLLVRPSIGVGWMF